MAFFHLKAAPCRNGKNGVKPAGLIPGWHLQEHRTNLQGKCSVRHLRSTAAAVDAKSRSDFGEIRMERLGQYRFLAAPRRLCRRNENQA